MKTKCEKCLMFFEVDQLTTMNCPRCGNPDWGQIAFSALAGLVPLVLFPLGVYWSFTDPSVGSLVRIVFIVLSIIFVPVGVYMSYLTSKRIITGLKSSRVSADDVRLKIKGNVYLEILDCSSGEKFDEPSFQRFTTIVSNILTTHNCAITQQLEIADFCIKCQLKTFNTGAYQSGAKAYQNECDIKILDKTQSDTLSEQKFIGVPPEFTTHQSGKVYGELPESLIKSYLLDYL